MIGWHEGVKFPCVIIQTKGHLTPSHVTCDCENLLCEWTVVKTCLLL